VPTAQESWTLMGAPVGTGGGEVGAATTSRTCLRRSRKHTSAGRLWRALAAARRDRKSIIPGELGQGRGALWNIIIAPRIEKYFLTWTMS